MEKERGRKGKKDREKGKRGRKERKKDKTREGVAGKGERSSKMSPLGKERCTGLSIKHKLNTTVMWSAISSGWYGDDKDHSEWRSGHSCCSTLCLW